MPIFKDYREDFALGEREVSLELVKLIELIPDAGEHYRDFESVWHQIARTGLEDMGFSLNSPPEQEIEEPYQEMMLTGPENRHRNPMLAETIEDRRMLFGSSLEGRDPLSDSGIHVVKNPGFGYD